MTATSEFITKRPSWVRYVASLAWWLYLIYAGAFHPYPHDGWMFGIFGTLTIWLVCMFLRNKWTYTKVNSLDDAIYKGKNNHVRGVEGASPERLQAMLEAQAKGYEGQEMARKAQAMLNNPKRHQRDPHVFDGWVKLAGVPIPPDVENLHFAITASTGAGKSVTLRGLLADIRRRGDRAIVIDNGGEFMRDFADDGDVVLSPFDPRSVGWNLANEIRAPHDWARMARSVIPDGHGSDKSWHEMAQTLFANIGASVGGDNRQLLDIATSYSAKMLEPILAGTSSAVLTQEGGERLLTNIRSVYANVLASWQYMPGGDFSLRDYMQGDDTRWLFVPFQESEFGISRSLIAAWMDMLVSAGLERPEGAQQTWVIIDELDTLGQLSSLIAATTKLRKRHVAVVTAFQSVSQLEQHYGQQGATTLLNCLSNKVVLRCTDAVTAERMSKELGERETWKENMSNIDARGKGLTGRSQQMERLVLASQIQNLEDLYGYIKLAGNYPVTGFKASIEAGRATRKQ